MLLDGTICADIDLQAAVGCEQLKKLPRFIEARRDNWKKLYDGLIDEQDKLILPKPTENSNPSGFGFIMTVKEDIDCVKIVQYLENNGIQTRRLFGGNLVKHPCFDDMREKGHGFRKVEDLANTDIIMERSFWVGVYPGLDDARINYMVKTIKNAVNLE